MGRDSQLLIIVFAVLVLGGAGAWFFFSGDGGQTTIDSRGPDVSEVDVEKPIEARRGSEVKDVQAPKPIERNGGAPLASEVVAEPLTGSGGQGGTINGTIADPNGAPIPHAVVALCEDVSDVPTMSLQGRIAATVESDVKGHYAISGINPDYRYMIRAEHDDFATATVGKIEVSNGSTQVVNVSMKGGVTLTGIVVDFQDVPIANASVHVLDQNVHAADPDDCIERRATTDSAGAFELRNINPGYKKVTATAPGYSTFTNHGLSLKQNETQPPMKLKLGTGSFLAGKVVDQEERPVEGAMIIADPIRNGPNSMMLGNYPSIKSGPDGTFRYEGLAPGSYQLTCRKTGYDTQGNGTRVTARTEQEDVVIKMQRAPTIRGIVVDGTTGNPVTKFSIQLARGDSLVFSSNRLTQRYENERGEFEYFSEAQGELRLFAEAQGFAGGKSDKLNVVVGQNVDGVVIRMSQGAVVKGTVTDQQGAPVAGATVELVPQFDDGGQPNPFTALLQNSQRMAKKTARTDAGGNYTFTQVPENSFKLRASHKDFSTTETDRAVPVGPSGEVLFPPLAMMRGGTIRGTVYDSDGKPEVGSDLTLVERGQFGGTSYTATSDGSGRFQIMKIRPGIYRIQVQRRGGGEPNMDIFKDLITGKPPLEVIVEDGGEVSVEVR